MMSAGASGSDGTAAANSDSTVKDLSLNLARRKVGVVSSNLIARSKETQ